MERSVELYDAMFAPKKQQGIPLCDTTLEALPIILLHRLEGVQESSTLFSNEVDRTRGSIT
jgi:hypothetical protein